ncbi:hypothetical protein GEV33_001751 [Tenebrio molitor]|uniref:DUF5641 domain-containing protein n=1 Tax=Tenebrio molitor TaxID=7067 RepID=A0A8J6HUL6_TENMO|nr:hypothetical protein GEV33_001751 [Tenebrio molitor]
MGLIFLSGSVLSIVWLSAKCKAYNVCKKFAGISVFFNVTRYIITATFIEQQLQILLFKQTCIKLVAASPQVQSPSFSCVRLGARSVRITGRHEWVKVKPSLMYPIMGNLPKSLVESTRPFSISGVDYAGPIYIKECRGRKNLANKGISWHFIPPRSPHMGGIWEINVKSIKGHLKRTIGEVVLSYEELYTLLTRIEAVLNSRPLCPLSNDPNDLNPITPGHFLIGEPLTSMSERDLTTTRINRLTQWQRVEQMRQHFLHRWQREYSPTETLVEFDFGSIILLINANEGCQFGVRNVTFRQGCYRPSTPALEIGSMVILVEDNTPPLQWKLGRIVELHPGSDGVVRVVSVKTVNGIFKRATRKVVFIAKSKQNNYNLPRLSIYHPSSTYRGKEVTAGRNSDTPESEKPYVVSFFWRKKVRNANDEGSSWKSAANKTHIRTCSTFPNQPFPTNSRDPYNCDGGFTSASQSRIQQNLFHLRYTVLHNRRPHGNLTKQPPDLLNVT